jgi:cytochrome P450
VTRYAEVRAIGRDPQRFSSEPTIMIEDPEPGLFDDGVHKMMLMMDPPSHTTYRKLISREFTQGPAAAMAPWIEMFAKQIVDAVIDKGQCDFMQEVAGEMPSYVIAKLMGLPLDDGRKLYALTETIHSAAETLPPGAQGEAVAAMFGYGQRIIEEKRARPTDDLASRLLAAEIDGKRLDDVDFLLFFLLLIDAGGDTTRNLLGSALLVLLEHPEVLQALREDPDRWLAPVRNECLRYCSPVTYMRRRATEDVEIAGQQVRAGQRVVLYYGAANRDERIFADPHRFDPTRNPNPHLAFGGGTHVCLGQHVARIEIDLMLREVVTRMHDLALAGEPEWLASNFISGPRVCR